MKGFDKQQLREFICNVFGGHKWIPYRYMWGQYRQPIYHEKDSAFAREGVYFVETVICPHCNKIKKIG